MTDRLPGPAGWAPNCAPGHTITRCVPGSIDLVLSFITQRFFDTRDHQSISCFIAWLCERFFHQVQQPTSFEAVRPQVGQHFPK